MDEHILRILPLSLRQLPGIKMTDTKGLQEIRCRIGQPVIIRYRGKEHILDNKECLGGLGQSSYLFTSNDMRQCLEYISNYSLYAYEHQVQQGFITVAGGHRVGICGSVTVNHGTIQSVKSISSLNIRIAHQIKGCAQEIYDSCCHNKKIQSTLLIGPPGSGKTTMLRDLIRLTSNGGETVGLVDERSELGASYLGVTQNDLGMRTDVMDACPKKLGLMMLLRAMAPQILAMDEIGSKEDLESLCYCSQRGCKVIATIHGQDIHGLKQHSFFSSMMSKHIFQYLVVMKSNNQPGTLLHIEHINEDDTHV